MQYINNGTSIEKAQTESYFTIQLGGTAVALRCEKIRQQQHGGCVMVWDS